MENPLGWLPSTCWTEPGDGMCSCCIHRARRTLIKSNPTSKLRGQRSHTTLSCHFHRVSLSISCEQNVSSGHHHLELLRIHIQKLSLMLSSFFFFRHNHWINNALLHVYLCACQTLSSQTIFIIKLEKLFGVMPPDCVELASLTSPPLAIS